MGGWGDLDYMLLKVAVFEECDACTSLVLINARDGWEATATHVSGSSLFYLEY